MAKLRKMDTRLVVIEDYMSGDLSIRDLAIKHGVPKSTIHEWIQEAGLVAGQYRTQKLEEAADLLADYLVDNLQSLRNQLGLLGDRKFLESTEPDRIQAISVSHGIISDKSVRILEAIERARAERDRQRLLTEGDAGRP